MTYKQALEHLNDYRQQDADRWGIFFLGTQVYLGNTRVYVQYKTARLRIISEFKNSPSKPYPPYDYSYYQVNDGEKVKQKKEFEAKMKKYKIEEEKYKLAYAKDKKRAEKVVDDLESTGMLEIRKIGDRSPKFPHNKKEISTEQADKFTQMLDASDQEMVKLAITILEKI